MKILTGFYNAEKYIERCLESIMKQTYKDYVCYITHDLSTDNSVNLIKEKIKDDKRFILIDDNEKKLYQSGNFDKVIRNNKNIDDNELLIEVDGDDYLPDDNVFERINNIYKDDDVWIATGSFNYSDGTNGFSKEQTDFDNLRNGRFTASHIRTWRAFLWRSIREEDLRDEEGNYWQWSGDVCFMFPMLEMAGKEHYRYMSDINYIYNETNPINEHKVNIYMVNDHADRIRKKPKYELLHRDSNKGYVTSLNIDNDDMVGRLGNKLFILAAALGTSIRDNKDFFIKDWKYKNVFPNIKIKNKDTSEVNIYNEPAFSFNEIPNIDKLDIIGYFQSEKYFKHISNDIRDVYFKPSKDIQDEVNELFDLKGDIKITSIHVRRGDYLNLQDFHPVQTMEDYFNEAIEKLDPVTSKYLIFSDDIPWCKENFKGDKFLFSENKSSIVDLFMMASCDNHIISNSSYGWWGGWLGRNKDKKVIAPSKWFGPHGPQDWQDVYADGWIVI
jgi:glycosyltransferase involved in cell wall biosynthesis